MMTARAENERLRQENTKLTMERDPECLREQVKIAIEETKLARADVERLRGLLLRISKQSRNDVTGCTVLGAGILSDIDAALRGGGPNPERSGPPAGSSADANLLGADRNGGAQ